MTNTQPKPYPDQCPKCGAHVKAGNRDGYRTKKPWILYACGNYEGAHWDHDKINCTGKRSKS